MCAQLLDGSLRILFEHGLAPSYPGFDLAIVSSFSAVEINRELYKRLKMAVEPLPYAIDAKSGWEGKPFSKKRFGFPEDSLIMTTISNHLDARLTHDMCAAIAEILRQVPNAYYAPMGRILNEKKFRQFFFEHGVADRVVFLGTVANPSQYASVHAALLE